MPRSSSLEQREAKWDDGGYRRILETYRSGNHSADQDASLEYLKKTYARILQGVESPEEQAEVTDSEALNTAEPASSKLPRKVRPILFFTTAKACVELREPWHGLQLEGLHYAQTGVIQHE